MPVSHAGLYAKALHQAAMRLLDGRNHQLNDDLSEVAAYVLQSGESNRAPRSGPEA